VSNAFGRAASSEAVLHVVVPGTAPSISGQPSAASVTEGHDASFSVMATGATPLAYQWRIGGNDIAGATGSSYTLAGATAAQSGSTIDVVVSNAYGSVVSDAVVLTVTAVPPPPGASTGARFAAADVSIAVLANGDVMTWGAEADLGDPGRSNGLQPGRVPTLSDVASVSTGPLHSLAVTTTGEVWAWGYDGCGQFGMRGGPGSMADRPLRITSLANVVAAVAADCVSVFLESDGTVWAAGENHFGQLGNGTTQDSNVVVAVPISDVVAISSISRHTLALKRDGTVWGWGDNTNCQLGSAPGDGLCLNQPLPMQIAGVANAFAVAAGRDHSLALVGAQPGATFGNVWGWGLNDRGQLGFPVANELVKTARETIVTPAAAISAGPSHSLLMHFDGTVFSFGDNRQAQLGDPTFSGDYSDTPRWLSTLPAMTAIFAGGMSGGPSAALAADGSLWMWGANDAGQLGNGSRSPTPRRQPAPVSGINLN